MHTRACTPVTNLSHFNFHACVLFSAVCTAALALDGLSYKGQTLRLRRPNDYVPAPAPLGPPIVFRSVLQLQLMFGHCPCVFRSVALLQLQLQLMLTLYFLRVPLNSKFSYPLQLALQTHRVGARLLHCARRPQQSVRGRAPVQPAGGQREGAA